MRPEQFTRPITLQAVCCYSCCCCWWWWWCISINCIFSLLYWRRMLEMFPFSLHKRVSHLSNLLCLTVQRFARQANRRKVVSDNFHL